MKRFKFYSDRMAADDPTDLKGLVSESHNCIDCGVNTAPGLQNRCELEKAHETHALVEQCVDERSEVYMVHNAVWKETGLEGYGGCLCIGCLEKRIGRRLEPKDFSQEHTFNTMPGTRRLRDRRGG